MSIDSSLSSDVPEEDFTFSRQANQGCRKIPINPNIKSRHFIKIQTNQSLTRTSDQISSIYRKSSREVAQDSIEKSGGLVPIKLWCRTCEEEVMSTVRIEMPTLSLWKQICCFSDLVKSCTESCTWEKYQKIHHQCVKCGKLLLIYEPLIL